MVESGEGFNIGQGGVSLAFDDDGVKVRSRFAGVCDDGTLGDLPVAILGTVALLVNTDGNTVEIEVGELAVGRFPKEDTAVGSKGEKVHQLCIVGMVDGVRKSFLGDDCIDERWAVLAADVTLNRRIDVTVEDARYIVTVIYADELAAERVAVAVFEDHQCTGLLTRGGEIHGQVFAVERQAGKVDPHRPVRC